MVAADATRFAEILNGLASMKPGKELTREALKLWWNAMQAWTIDDFADAAGQLAMKVEFMPSPFHFDQLRRSGEKTPGEAWADAVARSPHWRTGRQWGDRIERAARCVGGYQTIAMADIETSLPHIERRFLKHYEELCDVEETRKALPNIAVPALEERAVGRLGYDGDEE